MQGTEFYNGVFFPQHFKYFTPLSLVCLVSEEKSNVIIIFVPLLVRCFLSLASFRIFSFNFLSFEHDMPTCSLFLCLSCLELSELHGSVVWYLTLIWEILSHYCFKYFSCSFLSSSSGVPMTCIYTSTVLGYSLLFPPDLPPCFIAFQFWRIFWVCFCCCFYFYFL